MWITEYGSLWLGFSQRRVYEKSAQASGAASFSEDSCTD